ncbi:hypothetical protein [Bacillus cereus]|uniref:hypothetical protein n=1 Tax=Bacillus cereus TaxID=1396 RepID=UPI0020417F46|nr:hypothetical protein [Bacillus cereus]MCM3202737.1 hypothetical protein [Bacillus cereus]
MIKEVSLSLTKFEIAYEIHKSLEASSGSCLVYASSREIAKIKVEEEIKRRFKGAKKIVIL